MAMTELRAGDAANVQIDATKGDISRYVKSGDNLIVELRDGGKIVVSDFYEAAAGGVPHKLMLADGTFSGVEGTPDEKEEVAGLGGSMEQIGAGLGALTTASLAFADDSDDAINPADPTDPINPTDATEPTIY